MKLGLNDMTGDPMSRSRSRLGVLSACGAAWRVEPGIGNWATHAHFRTDMTGGYARGLAQRSETRKWKGAIPGVDWESPPIIAGVLGIAVGQKDQFASGEANENPARFHTGHGEGEPWGSRCRGRVFAQNRP